MLSYNSRYSIYKKCLGGVKLLYFLLFLYICEFFIKPIFVEQFSWFYLYIIGYYFSMFNSKHLNGILIFHLIIAIYTVSIVSWQDLRIGSPVCFALKSSISILIVYLLLIISNNIKVVSLSLVESFDRLSLYVYFVHYPLTRLPFCMLFITSSLLLNIVMTFVVILFSANVLMKLINCCFKKKRI